MKKLTLFSVLAIASANIPTHISASVFKIVDGVEICVEKGDITKSHAQTIVNAANPQLQAGGGVCGAIFAAAGLEQLQKACYRLPVVAAGDVRCPVGQACITDSFGLTKNDIKHIIHAVGPDCRIIKDTQEQDRLLSSAYRNALTVAEQNNIRSIAFPFISSAIYAFPKERAARVALEAAFYYAMTLTVGPKLSTITFVLYSDEDYDLFVKMLDKVDIIVALSAQESEKTSVQHSRMVPEHMHFGSYQKYQEYVQQLGDGVKPQPVHLKQISIHIPDNPALDGMWNHRLLALYDACDQIIATLYYDAHITPLAQFEKEFEQYFDLSKLSPDSIKLFRRTNFGELPE
ncbi:macro domain-containing protein [Candidatus Dependentiae bacterium]|nr:macro domain-containing protein [Candidatus Dependentiae bacterium]MCC7414986.1 macro domain-containing protein [Campylobacterota bacterium]